MALTYLEDVDGISSCTAGFSLEKSEATSVYMLANPSAADLLALPTDVLGGTTVAVSDGRMQRSMPLGHPIWPNLYASNIRSVVGMGMSDPVESTTASKVAANSPLEGPDLPSWWKYVWYKVTIDFTSRPYPVVVDDDISKLNGTWNYEGVDATTGQIATASTPVTFPYTTEWDRWTDLDVEPKEQAVQAQQGTMRFQSKSPLVSAQIFPGQPRMTLPNKLLKFIWYAVPYRYFLSSNSYLDKWVGRINQNAITLCGKSFAAGTLLYLGCKPHKFSPPVQTGSFTGAIFTYDKLVNLQLEFLWTTRFVTDLPPAPALGPFVASQYKIVTTINNVPTVQAGFGAGTITSTGAAVVGTGTFFTSALHVGDFIGSATNGWVQILAISDDTHLTLAQLPGGPVNANFIQAGWNLQPWVIDRKYHYALTQPINATGSAFLSPSPAFLSFPFEVMQYDPDAADALQTATY